MRVQEALAQTAGERSIRERFAAERRRRAAVQFLQFAIGSRVSPAIDPTAILTNRFRGRAIRILAGNSWAKTSAEQKNAIALFTGKGADGKPLDGHRHAFFALWFDARTCKAARLLVWRSTPFSHEEQEALLSAAEDPLSLGYNQLGKDPWLIQLVPLGSAVAPPPGFDRNQKFPMWQTMTPFVPPQHIYDRHGNEKRGKSLQAQVLNELCHHGFPAERAVIEVLRGQWVKVHQRRSEPGDRTNIVKRGHHLRLTFPTPVAGPLALGHSSHFGLGLFVPATNS
jgi:CRISPR-associated protein Csb2